MGSMSGVDFSGVWRSVYSYPSSSRQSDYADEHVVRISQKRQALTVKSIPGSASELSMQLSAEGDVLTGTWRERTQLKGYYKGNTYHGALQLVANPGRTRMEGKWIGVDSHGVIQSGPWELIRDETAHLGQASLSVQ